MTKRVVGLKSIVNLGDFCCDVYRNELCDEEGREGNAGLLGRLSLSICTDEGWILGSTSDINHV